MLTEKLVLHDDIRHYNLVIRVLLNQIMVAGIDGNHTLVVQDVELDVIDAGVGIGGDPAVFHVGNAAVAFHGF